MSIVDFFLKIKSGQYGIYREPSKIEELFYLLVLAGICFLTAPFFKIIFRKILGL